MTRHPYSNNKSRPNNITERQKDRHGRDYRVSLLVSIVRDGDVNFCRDSSRADVSPPRIEWRSNRWRVLRTRSEWIFAACCSSTPIIIPLIVRDGIGSSRDEFAAERWLFFGKVGEMVIFEERRRLLDRSRRVLENVPFDFEEVIVVDEAFWIIGINGLELNINRYIGGMISLILKR